MKIATWNVNSVKARCERLISWLARRKPDIVCIQEIKTTEERFPREAFDRAGYHAVVLGQKTYNGVAILARERPDDVVRGLDDGVDDSQARLISAWIAGVRVLSAYAPNGFEVGSEKWRYKLAWLDRLRRHLEERYDRFEPLVLCGDFNVAPEARDVHDPAAWEGSVLFHQDARQALRAIVDWGLDDVFRLHHAESGCYSWWDYRMLAFPRNMGLRIDHILASQQMAAKCVDAAIDREERKGKLPSDHTPVIAEFES
ncbi:MAG: exodeoxyribonuclease III [Vicinamibacteria bacterium]|nr:exodeoxyribonuclease III [Vicinamibacteria bacterium]